MGPYPQPTVLRFRVYVARRCMIEEWVELASDELARKLGDLLGEQHTRLAERAARAGLLWLAEVYDPAAPPGGQYLRFGTDTGMMTRPVQVTPEAWRDLAGAASFTCPECGKTSYSVQDAAEGYCGNCRAFTGGSP